MHKMNVLANNKAIFILLALLTVFISKTACCDEIWTKDQLITNLNSGAVREIAIVPGGIKGKYFDSYGRLEVFMVPERTPGQYSSFSPEIITLIQKHDVRVIPEETDKRATYINYGTLLLQVLSWLIIVIGLILLVQINKKLKKISDILSTKKE